jgi:hypothetical protein
VHDILRLPFGEDVTIALASSFEDWCNDEQFQDGCWMLVDIDSSRIDTTAVRLNISLPLNLVHRIDARARALHMSRSAFLAAAAEKEMATP